MDMSLTSSNNEVNSFTYYQIVLVCFSFFNATQASQEVFQGKSFSHNHLFNYGQYWKWSDQHGYRHSSKFSTRVWHHQSNTYMPTNEIFLPFGSLAALKYCSISHIKFSEVLVIKTTLKGKGSSTLIYSCQVPHYVARGNLVSLRRFTLTMSVYI